MNEFGSFYSSDGLLCSCRDGGCACSRTNSADDAANRVHPDGTISGAHADDAHADTGNTSVLSSRSINYLAGPYSRAKSDTHSGPEAEPSASDCA